MGGLPPTGDIPGGEDARRGGRQVRPGANRAGVGEPDGILHLVDRVLRVYTPTVLSISGAALVLWVAGSWLVAGQPDMQRAVFAALSVLVMGYPCAVGIAAPLAIVRGTGQAADRGIVMRTGEAFQTFRLVRHIVLDKTGTLTRGRPTVRVVEPVVGDAERLLALTATAESHSEHPLARAIVTAAEERGVTRGEVTTFDSTTGGGVRATVDGEVVLAGRPTLLTEAGINLSALVTRIDTLEAAGHTVIAVAGGREPLGLIALGDQVRPDAAQAVAAMRTRGMEPVLVTGDNERAARHIAGELGITRVHAGVRPEDKAAIVRELQADGSRIAMAGDGVNDAPALMQADVGIAAGGSTDIAVESADIVLLRDEVATLLDAQEVSRHSYGRTRGNVALAFTFNGIGIPIATTGLISPIWAMLAMVASVTSIFVNSIGTRPALLTQAIASVGRPAGSADAAADTAREATR